MFSVRGELVERFLSCRKINVLKVSGARSDPKLDSLKCLEYIEHLSGFPANDLHSPRD